MKLSEKLKDTPVSGVLTIKRGCKKIETRYPFKDIPKDWINCNVIGYLYDYEKDEFIIEVARL